MSGSAGQGGTVDFNTYLLRSGSRQGGQGGQMGLGAAQSQGEGLVQDLHFACNSATVLKPSRVLVKALFRIIPRIMPVSSVNPGITISTGFGIGTPLYKRDS